MVILFLNSSDNSFLSSIRLHGQVMTTRHGVCQNSILARGPGLFTVYDADTVLVFTL